MLEEAMKEAYADPTVEDDIIDTLELNHPTFDTPIRIVANADEDMMLPVVRGGPPVLHQALGVSIGLIGYDDDGPIAGELRLDNVSSKLPPYLDDAVKAGSAITVTYRAFLASDLTGPGEVRGGMFLKSVSLTPTAAFGTLEVSEAAEMQAFPRLTYSLDKYKALHGG